MGAVKNMIVDLEEKCFSELESEIAECEDIDQAQEKAMDIFIENDLLDYVGVDNLQESVSEMWQEKWYNA